MTALVCMKPGCVWRRKPLPPFQIEARWRKRAQSKHTTCNKCHAAAQRGRKPAYQPLEVRKDYHYGVAVNPTKSGPAPG